MAFIFWAFFVIQWELTKCNLFYIYIKIKLINHKKILLVRIIFCNLKIWSRND